MIGSKFIPNKNNNFLSLNFKLNLNLEISKKISIKKELIFLFAFHENNRIFKMISYTRFIQSSSVNTV